MTNVTDIRKAMPAIIHNRAGFSADGTRFYIWDKVHYLCCEGDGPSKMKVIDTVHSEVEAKRFLERTN